MATRIVDPRLFIVEAALIDWNVEARRRKRDVKARGPAVVVALRWHVNGAAGNPSTDGDRGIGLPTGPFTVWRRPSFASASIVPISFVTMGHFWTSGRLVIFSQPVAWAQLSVTSPAGGPIHGLASAPLESSPVTTSHAPAGPATVEVHGSYINGLIIPSAMTVTAISGIPVAKYEALPGWQKVEIVGMPVDNTFNGVGTHNTPQGLIGALVNPIAAAISRIDRGTPAFGWDDNVVGAVAAPTWKPPDPAHLVTEVRKDVVPALRTVLVKGQMDQAAVTMDVVVPPPATLDGDQMNAQPSTAHVSPMMLLRASAAADPFLSLALGYGTNLAEEPAPAGTNIKAYHGGSRWDYMITAPYAKGLDGNSAPVELTAYALRPVSAIPPFPPAQLMSEERAHLAPTAVDADWAASSIVRWHRPLQNALVRVASYAAARHDFGAAAAGALMEDRPSGGHKPIAPGQAEGDEQHNWMHLADRRIAIPNDPGERHVRYSVATQSIFSLWSPWQGVNFSTEQPKTPPPRIVASTLAVTPVSGKVCDGELTIDLTWDWTDRKPDVITLVGRMYAAADRAAQPPSAIPPSGLQRQINTAGLAVTLTFTGDTATVAGAAASPIYLSPAGDEEVAAGPAQGMDVRRYRLTIPGFTADFTSTPHIGLALWVRGTERISPHWPTDTAGPHIVYASDPVAPPVPPELVPLGSLPDAEGRSHARISWPVVPGAAGYIVYTSDELTMLAHYGAPEPEASATLSDRKTALLDLWEQSPDRRPFTRVNVTPLTGTSLDVVLPVGSTAIHAYAVVAISPGGVEGPWPSGLGVREAVIVRAAPRIASPPPPMLEAVAQADGSVELTVMTRAGHRADRIDLYRVRVDDAARSLDTMGPPLVKIGLATPDWTVEVDVDDDDRPLAFRGVDTPGGSWKRVWYRAVAWADDEWPVAGAPFPTYYIAERGLIRGRSAPSNPVSVVTPPPGEPPLTDVTASWPGGAAADVQLDFSTVAPLGPTPLGAHQLEVLVREPGAADALIAYVGELGKTPVTAPSGNADGLWRVTDAGAFRMLVHRSAAEVALDVVVRVIDPIGRASTRTLHVPPGSLLPEPELDSIQLATTPYGLVVSFTSDAPLEYFNGLAYVLKVTAVPVSGPIIQPLPLLQRAGALVPSREQPARTAVAAPLLPLPGKVLTLQVALPDVPLDDGQPPGPAPLQVRRLKGGRRRSYGVLARVAVSKFTLRLTSPDGRAFTTDVEVK